ncbi:hypothetical protein CLU79DRAFT_731702 [Phycomyces nitens]|nr:hypothetical protein CLU79DRAFT_731702 [Phycomyces nitens]
MDPGYSLLQHIKTIPNLINEDPSMVTPENTSFKDVPWCDLAYLSNQRSSLSKGTFTTTASSETSLDKPIES